MLLDQVYRILLSYWPLALFIIFASYLLHNKFNYGLNKYPGPMLAAYTDWWRFYDLLGRRTQHTHIQLHKQHGDIVRLGPNCLSFADPQAIKDIYGLNKGFYKTQFYPVQNSIAHGRRVQSLFSSTDEAYHARFRRCVNSAFALSTLLSYEPLVDATTEVFLAETEKRFCSQDLSGESKSCEFARWLQLYAFDVVGQMTWSKRLGFIESGGDVDGIIEFIAGFMAYAAPVGQQPWLDWLFLHKNPIKLLLGRFGFWNTTTPVARFAQDRSAERRTELEALKSGKLDIDTKDKQQGVDFLSRFTAAQAAHPDFMTDFQVLTATTSLVFAGSDTTAISLSSVFYHLLRHPRCLAALLSELDSAITARTIHPSPTGLISFPDAQKLPYLDAVITESFRLFPAVGLPLERHVPATGATICGERIPGGTICGERIPGGTIVGCNAWVLHRRSDVFGADVDAFRPERWLACADKPGEHHGGGEHNSEHNSTVPPAERNSKEKLKEMRAAMFHFGAGPRTCIGRNISTLEVYKLVPSFLMRFEVEFVDPARGWRTENCWFVRQLDFNVRFKVRRRRGVEGQLGN